MTDQTQVQRVESALKKIRQLKEDDEKAAKDTGKNFNVFSVLGVERKEVRHSAFLKDLLDPKGTHSQGAVFLEHFLNLEPLRLADSFGYGKLDDFQVRTEAATNANDGRMDILLKKDDAYIIIENKIDAEDQTDQLSRYYRNAKKRGFEGEQIKLIYLTLDGKPPSEKSLSSRYGQKLLNEDRVIYMSYESHIIKWLKDCLKEVGGIARIREVLLQYKEIIKELTEQPINEELTMEISDILTKEHDLIPELEKSILETKVRLQYKFWEKLRKKITEDCNIEFSKVSEDDVRRFFRKNGYLGIEYKVATLTSTFDIAFRVELDASMQYRDKVYYGFVLLENGSKFKGCCGEQFDKYANLADDALGQGNRNDYWLSRKDRRYQNQDSSFGYIAEEAELEELVETIAEETKDAADKFVKAKEDAGL